MEVTPLAASSSCISSGPVLFAIDTYCRDKPMTPAIPVYTHG
jgi:hypothetical protein